MPRLGIDRATKSTGAGADARNFENTGAAGRGRAEIGFFFIAEAGIKNFEMAGAEPGFEKIGNAEAGPGLEVI